ncbi:hypothetical protein [Spiroplasma poulsonii]|uniref:hypothetical protein n=1 Tax=Spiroplasma poulsonii TaxID=2138 RepID=UPI000D651B64|nr:hypothetical protein [Spiroplasma poulsonii]PWF96933.1 hypothetical protein SMSE_23800 [Spiroplasma poulsonii]
MKKQSIDAQTPVSDSEKDNDWNSYKHQMEQIVVIYWYVFNQALYKGNFEIIFYADNPYTNNEEDYYVISMEFSW